MDRDLYDLRRELWVRAESLIGAIVVLVGSLLPQVSLAAPGDVQVVESYDPAQMQFAENLAVGYNGNIYVSLSGAGAIAKRTPDGQQTITQLPIPGVTVGIALDIHGRVGCVAKIGGVLVEVVS